MIVCIAEKPSVARDIARILGATAQRDGYMEGNGYQVTWTFGHLCELKEPNDYLVNWRFWTLAALPMIPQRFGIKLIPDRGIEKQFETIAKLYAEADEIINCGDAGQEGELIQRWVMQLAKVKCPVKRLWISSMTDEAIKEGFANLKDQAQYESLYLAGLSRAVGDWLLGMNCTRLYTLMYRQQRGQVLSIGRVQTPTLALIVQRQKEIDAFTKLQFEAEFQRLSPGGAISYVEVPNMQDNIPAVLQVMRFIYDNIMYAELNTKSDYCQVCGFDGEIQALQKS